MIVKLLTEHDLEFLSLTGGCTGSSEYALVKMTHCWKLRVMAHFINGLVALFPQALGLVRGKVLPILSGP